MDISLSRVKVKGGTVYLLLCIFMESANFMPPRQKRGFEDGVLYTFQDFGRFFPPDWGWFYPLSLEVPLIRVSTSRIGLYVVSWWYVWRLVSWSIYTLTLVHIKCLGCPIYPNIICVSPDVLLHGYNNRLEVSLGVCVLSLIWYYSGWSGKKIWFYCPSIFNCLKAVTCSSDWSFCDIIFVA